MHRHSSGRSRTPAPAPTRLALLHPRAALSAWLAVVAVLAVVGFGVGNHLSPSGLTVGGSESARAHALTGASFDDGATVPVLLRGPRAAVKSQGRALARKLAGRPGVRVLSPWTRSAGPTPLRPTRDRALLLVSVTGDPDQTEARSLAVERIVADATSKPVRAVVTGLPALNREGARASLAAVHRAEAIALPLLLVALLLVFGSPLAAAIPALFGAATILAGAGALALLADLVRIDAFSLALASMLGLALAVDYSLLMVSRLREERGADPSGDPTAAVGRAAVPTVRTIAVAVAAILAAMAVTAALSPGSAVLSVALGVGVVAVLAAVGAAVAVPAALVLCGHHLDRFALAPSRHGREGVSARLATAATRGPVLGLIAVALLAGLSVPALGLRTAAPGPASLPDSSGARADHAAVTKAMGPGWVEPFEIVAVTRSGPVTTPKRLAVLERVQRRLADDGAVRAVLGPGAIARPAARLRRAGRDAAAATGSAPRAAGQRLRRLDRRVSSAASGVDGLHGALSDATAAAGRIEAGSRDVRGGVGALRSGLQGAGTGAQRLAARLEGAAEGAGTIGASAAQARSGARGLRNGAQKLGSGLRSLSSSARDLQGRIQRRGQSLDRIRSGLRAQRQQAGAALDSAERSLPRFGSGVAAARSALQQARRALAVDGAQALDDPLTKLNQDAAYAGAIATATPVDEARAVAASSARLADGADRLAERVGGLGGSVRALSGGTREVVDAISRLDGGADRLGAAFGAVRGGVKGLQAGVLDGERRTGELAAGLDGAQRAARGLGTASAGADAGSAPAPAPGFFDSGYFLLAALESDKGAAPFGVNVDRGGQGARIVVVPRYPRDDPRTEALYARLRTVTAELGVALGARAAVGGPAARLADYDASADARLPLIVIALALVTALLLGIMLRSIAVPLIGVALNLLAAGATLGLLALLFQGDTPLLGGPGEIDAVAVTAIFGIVFALSIDYQLFIVTRVREEWLRGAGAAGAVRLGLARTSRVVTGAALSMLGVFAAFGLSDVATLRQFGVGLAIAVVLDATVVRLMALPAALCLAGRWAWWVPGVRMPHASHESHVSDTPEAPRESYLPHLSQVSPAPEAHGQTSRYATT